MGWTITDVDVLEKSIFALKLELAVKIGVRQGMILVEAGCGQGGFTAAVAKTVGEKGKVLAVDVSDEYLVEFTERLDKYHVRSRVNFVQTDAVNLESFIPDGTADMATSYRLLEELKRCEDMPRVIEEMTRVAKKNGNVSIIELSTETRNEAEENYVRLHRESGDCFFDPGRIVRKMGDAGLTKVRVDSFETNIWFSPELARRDLEFAQVWFTSDEEKPLGPSIDKYGMKYPRLLIFSGVKG
jgi:cyclopropane fatty-acyl-phospholipid synthase-like methyltransferase